MVANSTQVPRQHKIKILLVAAVTFGLLVLLVGYILLSYVYRPAGQGPAGPILKVEAFQSHWSTDPTWLIGLGDSVTAGFGARPGYSYFDRLSVNPPDEFPEMKGIHLRQVFPKLIVTNLSVSGSTSIQLLKKQLPKLPNLGMDTQVVVVITTGGNDLIHDYGRTIPREEAMYGATYEQAQPWIHNFEQRLNSIIQTVLAKYPGRCKIFLANIYDPTDGFGDLHHASYLLPKWKDGLKILAAYNEVIQKMATGNSAVKLVDIHATFNGHGIHAAHFWHAQYRRDDPHYWFHENIEDPNERGYDALRRIFLTEMVKVWRR
jgi:lysophospholipase L1-like esterase